VGLQGQLRWYFVKPTFNLYLWQISSREHQTKAYWQIQGWAPRRTTTDPSHLLFGKFEVTSHWRRLYSYDWRMYAIQHDWRLVADWLKHQPRKFGTLGNYWLWASWVYGSIFTLEVWHHFQRKGVHLTNRNHLVINERKTLQRWKRAQWFRFGKALSPLNPW